MTNLMQFYATEEIINSAVSIIWKSQDKYLHTQTDNKTTQAG
jgi:hypothetical protein